MSSNYRSILNAQGSSFENTKSYYNSDSIGETNFPATADVGNLSYLENQANITFSVWFKTPNNIDNLNFNFLFIGGGRSTDARVQFGTSPTQQTCALNLGGTIVLSSSVNKIVSADSWYHLLYHFNGTSGKIYFNNLEQTLSINTSGTFGTFGTNKPTLFGGTGTLSPYNATQVACWDRVLTSTEISDVYNNGCPSDISSLNPNTWLKIDDAVANGLATTLPDSGSDNANIQATHLFADAILTDSPCN